jgi:hypothetical protein
VTALLIQPKFDVRSNSYKPALGVPVSVQRGYMIWDAAGNSNGLGYTGGKFGDGRDVINFQFNPSTIASTYAVANSSLQAALLYPVPGSTGTLLAPLQQSVSFDLYYDRLFELNYGTGANGAGTGLPNDPGVIGCQADVIQFMQFTGMFANLNSTSSQDVLTGAIGGVSALSGTQVTSGQLSAALGAGGIEIMLPTWLFFSNLTQAPALNATQGNSVTALNSQLKYYGFIDSWSVQYTHWTESMVPIRCVISVSFTMLPSPTSMANYNAIAKETGNVGFNLTGPTLPTPTGNPSPTAVKTALETTTAGVAGR